MSKTRSERAFGLPRWLVYLHGHGSSPEQIHPFFREHADDGWVRLCPSAAIPTDGGYGWFADGARGGADAGSLAAATDAVCAVVDGAIDDSHVGRANVVVGGFSQGVALALAVAAEIGRRGGDPLGGLLLQAAFIPEVAGADFPLDDVAARSVLVQHPADDEVVPAFMGKDLADALGTVPGVGDVRLEIIGGGHVMSPEMLAGARQWLDAL